MMLVFISFILKLIRYFGEEIKNQKLECIEWASMNPPFAGGRLAPLPPYKSKLDNNFIIHY